MTRAYPKPRPRLLITRETAATQRAKDVKERAKCRTRSGGQCEVIVRITWLDVWVGSPPFARWAIDRCPRRASENHHLIGGIGRRNRGRSLLAAHRLDVCTTCHREITEHVLKPLSGANRYNAATVMFTSAAGPYRMRPR